MSLSRFRRSGPVVYSANDFNVAVQNAVQQTWWDCFRERTRMEAARTRDGGGVDGTIWPADDHNIKVSFRTFPSPELKPTSAEVIAVLKGSDMPCLVVSRLRIGTWTQAAIQDAYHPPLRFLQWTGSSDDMAAVGSYLRMAREAISNA